MGSAVVSRYRVQALRRAAATRAKCPGSPWLAPCPVRRFQRCQLSAKAGRGDTACVRALV